MKSLSNVLSILPSSITQETAVTALKSLHSLGFLLYVELITFDESVPIKNVWVVLDPKWLADIFKTVVTVRHSYVKGGVIHKEKLDIIWKEYGKEFHEPLLKLLSDLDVMVKVNDDSFLLPCLLPPNRPDHIRLSYPNGVTIRRSYFVQKGDSPLLS